MTGVLPATRITAIVSPTARPIPNTTPDTIPDRAVGRLTFLMVCHFEAPSASDPSLYAWGTALSDTSAMLIMVGRIMIARINPAASTLYPGPSPKLRINGTRITIPKKPNTIEGIPARISIHFRSTKDTRFGAISAKKNGASKPDRYADKKRNRSRIYGSHNHWEYSIYVL